LLTFEGGGALVTDRVPKKPSAYPFPAGHRVPAETEDTAEPEGQFPALVETDPDEHQGGTEDDVGDTTGPGAGYDEEPEQDPDSGGVTPS
jgi:hypothetical protein